MLSKRIIPCLDIDKGRVVKGVNFINLVDAGDPVEIAKAYDKIGAGEVLLTSMDKDGTKSGYDIELTRRAAEAVNVPVIASGGAGKMQDFADVLTEGKADAALAASLFHFGEIEMKDLKEYLAARGIPVRRV